MFSVHVDTMVDTIALIIMNENTLRNHGGKCCEYNKCSLVIKSHRGLLFFLFPVCCTQLIQAVSEYWKLLIKRLNFKSVYPWYNVYPRRLLNGPTMIRISGPLGMVDPYSQTFGVHWYTPISIRSNKATLNWQQQPSHLPR